MTTETEYGRIALEGLVARLAEHFEAEELNGMVAEVREEARLGAGHVAESAKATLSKAERSLDATTGAVRAAIGERFRDGWAQEIFENRVIVQLEGSGFLQVGYEIDEAGAVTLDPDTQPVEIQYVAIAKSEGSGILQEMRGLFKEFRDAMAGKPQGATKAVAPALKRKAAPEPPGGTTQPDGPATKAPTRQRKTERVGLLKTDDEKHLIYGVVYEPNVIDAHGGWMAADDIEKACHSFLDKSQEIGLEHSTKAAAAKPVENYIAPADFEMEGQTVTKGSWVMVTHVDVRHEDGAGLWKAIKSGDYTGYSWSGWAAKTPGNAPPAEAAA